MQVLPLSSIEVRKRQRTKIETSPLNELKESILGRGLLHAPGIYFDGTTPVLGVGERRLEAIKLIAKEGKSYNFDNQVIAPGFIPVSTLNELLEATGRFEAELDENIFRADLTWQDKTRALSDLHELRRAQNPQQTLRDTAREITQRQTGVEQPAGTLTKSADAARKKLESAVLLAKHLENPKIANARNAEEAIALVYKQEEERLTSTLVRRRLATVSEMPEIEIKNASSLELLQTLPQNLVDLILADPPYGVGASAGGFRQRTVHHHNYEDTVDIAKELALHVLTEGFRITKPRANIFIFCDIDLFDWLRRTAANMGWTPFRTPIVWQKSETEGMAPWGSAGFRRTYELLFYATKGQRGLISSPVDILEVKRVSRSERLFAAEKPVELLRQLISCSTLPGDFVLDPCCGSGSTLVAAKELRRKGLGIERDVDTFNTAIANVFREKEDDNKLI